MKIIKLFSSRILKKKKMKNKISKLNKLNSIELFLSRLWIHIDLQEPVLFTVIKHFYALVGKKSFHFVTSPVEDDWRSYYYKKLHYSK